MTGFAMGPFGPLFEAGPGARKISTGVFNAKYLKAAEDRLLGDRRDRSRQCHALDTRAGARRRWWRRRRRARGWRWVRWRGRPWWRVRWRRRPFRRWWVWWRPWV